jgi:GWxTD domain-containing protein
MIRDFLYKCRAGRTTTTRPQRGQYSNENRAPRALEIPVIRCKYLVSLEWAMGAKLEFRRPGVAKRSLFAIAPLILVSVLIALLPLPRAAAQKQKLEKGYKQWLERDVAYFITNEERNIFLKLKTDDERDQFIQNFWELRNPNPGSQDNKFKEDVYDRIAYANAHFGAGANEEGWRTDRGRAYITLGPPQQKEVHYNAANMFPVEIWFYSFSHPSLPPFFYLMFYRHEGFGDFRFYSPFIDGPDKLVTGTEHINDRQGSLRAIQDSVGPLVARLTQSLIPDEPIDPNADRPSLQSDTMLATIKGLANNPFTKQDLDRRRAMIGNVTARMLVPGQNLDVATLPLRDSRGLTRLDYAMRFRQPSEISFEERSDGRYFYNVQVQVRVYDADKPNRLIFTHEQNVTDTIDKQQFDDMKNRRVGYEGTLPLPPGKFRLEFVLTDAKNKKALQAQKDVVVPEIGSTGVAIGGVIPYASVRQADPASADLNPFTLAGLTFVPLGTNPLTLAPDEPIQVAYQIWSRPQDPAHYADEKMTVEYAVGRPAVAGGAAVVSEDIAKDQFDPTGSLVNGKKLPLLGQPPGSYMLSVSVNQTGAGQRAFSTLPFSVLPGTTTPDVWDITDPMLQKDFSSGAVDRERALCLLEQGKADEARAWFRRALARNHGDDVSRSRLIEAYSARNDNAAIQSLYKDAGITDETDPTTILRIAAALDQTGGVRDAIALLESALRTRQENGALYLALAGYYRKSGDLKKAADAEAKGKPLLGAPSSPSPAAK